MKKSRVHHVIHVWTTSLFWWISEFTRILKWKGILGSILCFLGPALQVNSILIVLSYSSWLSSNEVRSYFGMSLVPRESPALMFFVASVVLILLLTAGFMQWLGYTLLLKSRFFVERSLVRLLLAFFENNYYIPSLKFKSFSNHSRKLLQVLRSEVRIAGRVSLSLHLALSDMFLVIISSASLIWISPFLSFLISPVLTISAIYIARTGRMAAQTSVCYTDIAPLVSSEFRNNLGYRNSSSLVDTHPFSSSLDLFFRMLNAKTDSGLISDTCLAVLVFFILCLLGPGGPAAQTGWQMLVGYLIALRFFQTYTRKLITKLSVWNRFYPRMIKLKTYLENISQSPAVPNATFYEINLLSTRGSHHMIRLERGVILPVFLSFSLSPTTLFGLAKSLMWNKSSTYSFLLNAVLVEDTIENAFQRARLLDKWIIVIPPKFHGQYNDYVDLEPCNDFMFVFVYSDIKDFDFLNSRFLVLLKSPDSFGSGVVCYEFSKSLLSLPKASKPVNLNTVNLSDAVDEDWDAEDE